MGKKYKKIGPEVLVSFHIHGKEAPVSIMASRIKALIDIPEHGVKAGDIGGYLAGKAKLEQKGTCWVGGDAILSGRVVVRGDALVDDKAILYSEAKWPEDIYVYHRSKISGNAQIILERESGGLTSYLAGESRIGDNAVIKNVAQIAEYANIGGNALVEGATSILGAVKIADDAYVGLGATLSGAVQIMGSAYIAENNTISGYSLLAGDVKTGRGDCIANGRFETQKDLDTFKNYATSSSLEAVPAKAAIESGIPSPVPSPDPENDPGIKSSTSYLVSCDTFAEISAKISAYESDVVSLIKYPLMADCSHPATADMVLALSKAEKLSKYGESDEFVTAVEILERAFVIAESTARRTAGTMYSAENRKKAERAKDLIAIATNDVSSENEKRTAFKQVFRQLEGVVAVPEAAISAFRGRVGIPELEA